MSEDANILPSEAAPARQSRTARLAEGFEWLIPRAVGFLFLYAGAKKLWDPTKTMRVLAFDGVPESLVKPLTYVVSGWEVVLGALLVVGLAKRRAIVATILTLLVYSVQLAYLITAQNPPKDCACIAILAKYASAKQQLTIGLVRNAVLAAALEWTRLRLAGRSSSPAVMDEKPEDG